MRVCVCVCACVRACVCVCVRVWFQRFGPPNQDYYYKKSDDVQPDDPEASEVKPTLETDGKQSTSMLSGSWCEP